MLVDEVTLDEPESLFAMGDLDEDASYEWLENLSRQLRSLVRTQKFRSGDESEIDALYDSAYEVLNSMGCGLFWGFVAAHREYPALPDVDEV